MTAPSTTDAAPGRASSVVALEPSVLRVQEHGGKAVTLGALRAAGFRVPEAFCVGTAAFAQWDERLSRRLGGVPPAAGAAALRALEAEARALAEQGAWDAELESVLRHRYRTLLPDREEPAVAVRSSAPAEDGPRASFAGVHATSLGVLGGAQVVAAVRRTWASAWSAPALAYRRRRGLAGEPRMAVLVQRMLRCELAGVLFTRDPLDPHAPRMRLEAVRGTGERLVAGRGADESWLLSRASGSPAFLGTPSHAARLCDTDRLHELRQLGLELERLLGGPQDVEWGVEAGRLYVLQARPVTGVDARVS